MNEIQKAVNNYQSDIFPSIFGNVLKIEIGKDNIYEVVEHLHVDPHSEWSSLTLSPFDPIYKCYKENESA